MHLHDNEVDGLLQKCGGCGPAQMFIIFLASCLEIAMGAFVLLMVRQLFWHI